MSLNRRQFLVLGGIVGGVGITSLAHKVLTSGTANRPASVSATIAPSPSATGQPMVATKTAIAPKTNAKQAVQPKQSVSKQPIVTVKANNQAFQPGSQAGTATLLSESIATEKPISDLPSEWTEFMVQLPEYELQALKVIVEQAHPAAALKHIAEENLTMPELLIDSINERALETVGDLLIDAGSGAGSATIVRDHLKIVKKLLKTYDYLVH